jgi:O-antigen biosynthesis protein
LPGGHGLLPNRLRALYLRYVSHHAGLACAVGLPRRGFRRLGQVERVVLTGEGLSLAGWAIAPEIRVRWPGGARHATPDRPRPDVARRRGGDGRAGFEVVLPRNARPLTLEVTLPSGERRRCAVPHPDEAPRPAARRRMLRAFLKDLARAVPALLLHALRPGTGSRSAVKRALGLETAAPAPRLDPRWITGAAPAFPEPGPFTIVMPVHDAYDMTREALDRVSRHTRGDWHIVLVDDASRDPRMGPFLAAWAAAEGARATLLTLERNMGFVFAVNRALEVAEGRAGPVILLNSDAFVPEGWAERLLAPLSDPRIASVTPFSNDAEIFGAPLPGVPVPLAPGLAVRIDAVARTLAAPGPLPVAPTGVGFCMSLSRRWLASVPRLDPAFGRGYGEEVDWCQKVRRLGGRHVGQPALFVEHRGGGSFGAAKAARVRQANALITRRHPGYDAEVQVFFTADPLRTPRMALAVAAAGLASEGPLPLYLGHAMGGGAEAALAGELAARLAQGGQALVLRVGGSARFRLEVHRAEGVLAAHTEDAAQVRALLAPVPALRIVYSCGVGDRDPAGLPEVLLSLHRPGDLLEARLHDYFPLSPSYCLLGSDGRYLGPSGGNGADPAHRARRPDGRAVPLAEWRRAWGGFLAECGEITVFSAASAAILNEAFPDLGARVRLAPHRPTHLPATVPPPEGPGAIGILGNLNAQKGASVVAGLAERLRRGGDPRRLVVVGNVDATCPLPASVRIHGGYRREEIAALARRHAVSCWIVPSIWPETFSFATHEALATGLPVLAFDLGAQGEAVAAAPNGIAVPFDAGADPATVLAVRMMAALPRPGALSRRSAA